MSGSENGAGPAPVTRAGPNGTAFCLLPHRRAFGAFEAAAAEMGKQGCEELRFEWAKSWGALLALARSRPPEFVVVDPFTAAAERFEGPDVEMDVARLAQLLAVLPNTVVVVCARVRPLAMRDTLALGRMGITHVVESDELASPYRLASTLRGCSALGRGYRAIESLANTAPRWCIDLLKKALPHTHRSPEGSQPDERGLTSTTLARLWLAGANRQQLARSLDAEGLPTPGWIARWLVVLRAVILLETGRSLEAVAFELGFSYRRKLRERAQRLIGRSPRDTDVDQLLRLFRDEVEKRRAARG